MTGRTISHYRVLDKLGEGGMGSVFRAVDTRLGRTVAIKVVNAAFTQRFEREARAIAALNHPHICTLHDVGEHEGAPFLVMEFVEGKPLQGPLPVDEALQYAIQIAHALAAAHEAGIVHRDLKPDNILLTAKGSVKILDFGLAKLHQTAPEALKLTTMTEQGAVAGTGPYMSPEQAQGEPVDARSDIFSFGAVLYELLSGRRAFARETFQATLVAVVAMEPEPLREAPPTVARIVAKMLAKDRAKRYQSAEAALQDLATAAREKPWWQTRRAVVGMAATPVALAGAALGFNVRGWRTQLMNWMEPPAAAAIRLAVMPFVNMTGDPEQEFFSDGITQELIAQLGSLHPAGLNVIARTSVMRYKKTTKTLEEVARELKVEYLLEGSARREGGRARITTELIRARDQIQLWAETFERDLSGILVVQSEVARKVAGALVLKLLPAEQARLADARPVDPEAYEACLKGTQHALRMTPEHLDSALEYFNFALEKDPDYAQAYRGISSVWGFRAQMGFSAPAEARPKARAAAMRAIELSNTPAEAHSILAGLYCWQDWDWPAADAEFNKAIALNPSLAVVRATHSHRLMFMKRPAEAMSQIQRALELDPLNEFIRAFYAVVLYLVGRYDEAIAEFRRVLATSPGLPFALWMLASTLHMKGRYEEAVEVIRTSYPGDREMGEALTQGYAQAGYRGAMKRAADLQAVRGRKTHVPIVDVANLYVWAGEKDQALEWLEKGLEARDPNMPYINIDPANAVLRSEPRFQAIVRRMKLP
ncbi:MAG: protein kinase [Bryobacteraceae bacterium]|nr:protein kinase [Bryobacteraceae bacterium]